MGKLPVLPCTEHPTAEVVAEASQIEKGGIESGLWRMEQHRLQACANHNVKAAENAAAQAMLDAEF